MNNLKNQNLSQQIKLLIFDFWGTLAYPKENNPKEFYSFLESFGFQTKSKEKVQEFSSFFSQQMCFAKSWENLSIELFKKFNINLKENDVVEFKKLLKRKMVFQIYDDVKNAFEIPIKKAILTDSANFLIKDSGLQKKADVFTPTRTGALKPDLKVFLAVLNTLRIKPEEAVMIGDSIKRDLIPAEKLGIRTILIDRKNKFPDYAKPRINSFKKLASFLGL